MTPSVLWDVYQRAWPKQEELLLCGCAFAMIVYCCFRLSAWLWRSSEDLPTYYKIKRELSWFEYLIPAWCMERSMDGRRRKYQRRHKTSSFGLDTIPEEEEMNKIIQ
ncbi:hypothetical protein THRCLA_22249 [Thraustotheca clavata]|uniref:Uncharacterized protein n=1 Tax=Thraustotheca clavata TaxID=74557 RepID=A0A1V9Z899_9STRA|nr:hypothetical protein THRCLA_22249 [Thraustotheca clavata]